VSLATEDKSVNRDYVI